MPVHIFFCYAHEDEAFLNTLKTHLSPLLSGNLVDVWYDRDISGGSTWATEIDKHLNEADIILLLVSPDFMASDYCYGIEMQRALERDQRGEARVIPIILRPTIWEQSPFRRLQAFPKDGIPVTDPRWNSIDFAFYNVTVGIQKVVKEIIQERQQALPTASEPLIVRPPAPSPLQPIRRTLVKPILIVTIVVLVFALIGGGVILLKNNFSSATPPTPTPTHSTITPISTSSPQSTFLYQADFAQGDQGWLKYAHSPQWTYNAKDRVLESTGSLSCCSASTISTIIIDAPYTLTRSDYTVQARIRVTGINTSHPYTESDPQQDPFFGLYVRGDLSKAQGYMAGINGLPIGDPHAGAYGTFLAFGSAIPQGKIFHGKDGGGKDFVLDPKWHTYRLDVKGNTFMLSIDSIPVYAAPMQDSYFPSGPNVGLEDYDFYLQVQNFTVSFL